MLKILLTLKGTLLHADDMGNDERLLPVNAWAVVDELKGKPPMDKAAGLH